MRRFLLVFIAFGFHGWLATCQKLREVTADQIPVDQQTYDFSSQNRCRLFAHDSCILKNDNHYILLIEGGFGTFQTRLGTETVSVADLNPHTAAFDLSRNFATDAQLEPLWSFKKLVGSAMSRTIVNFPGLWPSADHNSVYAQGGHFYHGERWRKSAYYMPKAEIPGWELWRMDVKNHKLGWNNITTRVNGYVNAARTFAGVAASPPNSTQKFWLGGLLDSTTSSTSPDDTFETTDQMLIFDESENTMNKTTYYQEGDKNGFWQGKLIHLPIGNRSGYLMSLMSLQRPLQSPWLDLDGESGTLELGNATSLDSIPFYDVTAGQWFRQTASWFNGEIPEARTRFCAALFENKTEGRPSTWDLWVHGGQKVDNQEEGVPEIYVLSMPSFIWKKITTTLPVTNLIRSHTCHPVGGQLLVIGGYPTGLTDQANVTCDPEYIKVLDIEQHSITWTNSFRTNTTYTTPEAVRNVAGGRETPYSVWANEQLQADFAWYASNESVKPSGEKLIVKLVVPIVVGVVLLAVFGLCVYYRKQLRQFLFGQHNPTEPPRLNGRAHIEPAGVASASAGPINTNGSVLYPPPRPARNVREPYELGILTRPNSVPRTWQAITRTSHLNHDPAISPITNPSDSRGYYPEGHEHPTMSGRS